MRNVAIITIIIVLWVSGLYWLFTKFMSRSAGQETKQSTISTSDLLDEQRRKSQQIREDQKRLMENLQRKIRDHRR